MIVSNVVGALRAATSAPVSLAPLAPLRAEPLNPLALTVLAGNGVESVKALQGRYTFGSLDILTTHAIEHTFTLRNDTKNPVTLIRLGSSCGCTSAFAEPIPPNKLPGADDKHGEKSSTHTLRPGEKIAVHVSVDASRLRSGAAKKLVWVFAQGSGQPAATLEIVGVVQSPVTFSPSVLNFGRVMPGQAASLPLTVTFDPRLRIANQPLPLVCTNPNIQIVPEPTPPLDVKSAQKAAAGMVTRVYRVQIAPGIQAGQLSSTISFVQMPVASATAMDSHAAPTALLLGSPVVLIGEVVADPKRESGK